MFRFLVVSPDDGPTVNLLDDELWRTIRLLLLFYLPFPPPWDIFLLVLSSSLLLYTIILRTIQSPFPVPVSSIYLFVFHFHSHISSSFLILFPLRHRAVEGILKLSCLLLSIQYESAYFAFLHLVHMKNLQTNDVKNIEQCIFDGSRVFEYDLCVSESSGDKPWGTCRLCSV